MFLLASCAAQSRLAERAPDPKPQACPPDLTAEVRVTPKDVPDGAGLVQPATDAERQAFAKFMDWAQRLVDTALENEDRARKGKANCEQR